MKKTFAILTSGGDSPGMNCAIRSFVRTSIHSKNKVLGVYKGYEGLIDNEISPLVASSVGNIIQRGGTILQSSRSERFRTKAGRKAAAANLKKHNIDGLVVIGGDGSFKGAHKLSQEHGVHVVGIPGTIDNDISGTDYTIGHDTAVQTAIEAVDKIRDTAFSHDRVFLIEVMGRRSASLALKVALATGAEDVIMPSKNIPYKKIVEQIQRGIKRGKKGSIYIVAEGANEGRSYQIHDELLKKYKVSSRVCILGHIQRGGSPSSKDRIIASLMGNIALDALNSRIKQSAVISSSGGVSYTMLEKCVNHADEGLKNYRELIQTLSI